jgi:murein DD-endopeptidase MepM/ murein hydrolase activator NlpD
LLNPSVGVQRVIGRLRTPRAPGASSAAALQVRGSVAAHQAQRGLRSILVATHLSPARPRRMGAVPATRSQHRSVIARLGPDRTVAIAVAGILLAASAVSVSAGGPAPATGGTGGTSGYGVGSRLVVGGDAGAALDGTGSVDQVDPGYEDSSLARMHAADLIDGQVGQVDGQVGQVIVATPNAIDGPFLDDGTLLKPVAVDTTVADGADLVKTYKVKSGDTLTGVASKFRISMMTVWWANDLKSKTDLHVGQVLRIPPVSGLVVNVGSTDTLDAIAARYDVNKADILAINGLDDPNLVVGQVLVVPGAAGKGIATPKPVAKPAVKPRTVSGGGGGGGSSSGSSRPPVTYSGGRFLWPVVGGGNYISQYFHYGHYALDIAADYGSEVRAAGSGVVTFAGWKDNGGGYQVWISHGSNLYTTYNHMSAITVGRGQHVGRGQQVGRIGMTGNATGPHLHFEVWIGPVWDGGQRVNPLGYL